MVDAQAYAEAGFMHAAQWHKVKESQELVAATYSVAESCLVEAIAKQNWDFVIGASHTNSTWSQIDDNEKESWLDEAGLMYKFLLSQGWTAPTI